VSVVHPLSHYRACEAALRSPHLKQALYDAGAVVMEGTLLTLHGPDHAVRRAVEVRVFRRNFLRHYAREIFPRTLEDTLAPYLVAGGADLIELGYRATANLTADFAGIDRPDRSAEESEALIALVRTFSEGATMVHSRRDPADLEAAVRAALDVFDARFLAPSIARRRAILAAGDPDDLPRDILGILLEAADELPLDAGTLRREMAFYMQAGAHSTANAVVHSFHEIREWAAADPGRRARLLDPLFLQRAVHESLRLHPASPEAWRTATAPLALVGTGPVAPGDRLVLDLHAANRDPAVFGSDADAFAPDRPLPDGVLPSGLTFGIGMHACLGRELDGGTLAKAGADPETINLGIVPLIVQRLFALGAEPDPADPPTPDPKTSRPNWGRYPVRFGAGCVPA
jgi:cytochrome P450